ncbi:MAG: NAD(P)/FAD-dependent oxidoreductase, partial [Nitrososphaerota archaeon]
MLDKCLYSVLRLVCQGKSVPKEKYDVIIVGASPAGIFAALELTRKSDLSVLIIDKGRDISQRQHQGEALISGW